MTIERVLAIFGAIVVLATGFAAYGALEQRVTELEKRVDKLETKAMPGTKLGDLCLKLLDTQSKATAQEALQRINDQITRLNCWDGVTADAAIADNGVVMEPPSK